MVKSCSLLKEEGETAKCYGKLGHDKSFEEMISLIMTYAAEKNLTNQSLDTTGMTGDTCSIELFELIKNVQTDLKIEPDGIAGKATLAALQSTTASPTKPVAKKTGKLTSSGPLLIVGDSIATGMTVAAANQGIINQPQCKGSWYGKCETAVAKGGLTAQQIKTRLSSYLSSAQSKSAKPGKLILSAGTNDAIAYAKGVGSYTPQKTSALIDQIISMATGYQVIVKTIGPVNSATKTGKNTNFVTKYNEFAGEVNKHIQSKYKTFSGAEVPFAANDFIHPSKTGSAQLLARAISGTPATAAPAKPVTSTDKDDLIVVGDSNANYIAKKWLGRKNYANIERPGYPKKTYHLVDTKTKTPLAPQISGGQVSHILRSTKEFYELKGENYKPTTAIVHMGYNGSSDGQLNAFKETISFLKSKGVSDIRVIEVKVDTTKMSSDTFRKTMTDRAARVNNLIRSLSGITIIPNQGDNRNDGYHFTQGGYQAIYGAAMSGTSAPVAKDKIKVKPRGPAVEVASKGFPDFISEKSRGSTIRILSSFGSFSEVMDSVTQIFKAAAAKVNLQVSENPTIEDLKNLQSKLGLDSDGSFGPTSMAAISLINSKYASGVVSEGLSNAINLKSHLVKSFRGLMEQSLNNLLQEGSKFGTIDVDIYVDQYASASVLGKAYRGAVSKGLSVKKPPMSNKYSKKDTSWREDKEFLRKVKAYSDLNSVDPKMFLAFIAHETAGTFSPYMENHIGCTGLIQFCPGENAGMASISMNGAQLKAMTRSEQWDQVEIFYNKNKHKGWHKGGGDIATLYMITFSPAFADFGDDDVIYSKDPKRADPRVKKLMKNSTITKRWKQNPANRNPDDKDIITKAGLRKKLLPNYSKYKITDKLFEV